MLICIEGIDASGKHTQAKRLAEHIGATLISFPSYETPMGKAILGHLKRYWSAAAAATVEPAGAGYFPDAEAVRALNALVFQALQVANRMERSGEIKATLASGKSVVLDRYWPSGWVYGTADGLDRDYLLRLHECLPKPDLAILLDVDPDHSVLRRPERRDRYEEDSGMMETAAELYRRLWVLMHNEGKGWVVQDGRGSVNEVWQGVLWRYEQALTREASR